LNRQEKNKYLVRNPLSQKWLVKTLYLSGLEVYKTTAEKQKFLPHNTRIFARAGFALCCPLWYKNLGSSPYRVGNF